MKAPRTCCSARVSAAQFGSSAQLDRKALAVCRLGEVESERYDATDSYRITKKSATSLFFL